eukprot:TRINITY_DN21227_c0_g1_i1.p1 TRINITY_DN21227_c0_g1~~TRINITY_DN21227_c0_g1_i1.p1  ORF type:complete len:651 (+),score=172.64 TRINITY_DN21227_c0_g1_i1:82-2034(+)
MKRAVLCAGAEAVALWRAGRLTRRAAAKGLWRAWEAAMNDFVVFQRFGRAEVVRCLGDLQLLQVGPEACEVRRQLLQRAGCMSGHLAWGDMPAVLTSAAGVYRSGGAPRSDYHRLTRRAQALLTTASAADAVGDAKAVVAVLGALAALKAPPSRAVLEKLQHAPPRAERRPLPLLVQLLVVVRRLGADGGALLDRCEELAAKESAAPAPSAAAAWDGRCWLPDVLVVVPDIGGRQPYLVRWVLRSALSHARADGSAEDRALRVRRLARVVSRCAVLFAAGRDGGRAARGMLTEAAPLLDTRVLPSAEMARVLRTYAAAGAAPPALMRRALRKLYGRVDELAAAEVYFTLWVLRRTATRNPRFVRALLARAEALVASGGKEVGGGGRGVVVGALAHSTHPWEVDADRQQGAEAGGQHVPCCAWKVRLAREAAYADGGHGVAACFPAEDAEHLTLPSAVTLLEAVKRQQRRTAPAAAPVLARALALAKAEATRGAAADIAGLLRLAQCVQYFRHSLAAEPAFVDLLTGTLVVALPVLPARQLVAAIKLFLHRHNAALLTRGVHAVLLSHAVRQRGALPPPYLCSLITVLLRLGEASARSDVERLAHALAHRADLHKLPRATLAAVAQDLAGAGMRNDVLQGFLAAAPAAKGA